MKLSLKYIIVDGNGRELEAIVEQTIFDAYMLPSTAYEWAWNLVKTQRWEYASKWILEVNGNVLDIPEWGVKFVHGSCPNGFSVEDGGITETTFWLTKPFTPFSVEEINLVEREWSSSEDDQWVLKDAGMPTGGVLITREYPIGHPAIELSCYVADILPYGRPYNR